MSAEPQSPQATPPRRSGRLIKLALALLLVGILAAWVLPPLASGYAGMASGPPDGQLPDDPDLSAAQITFVASGEVRFGVEVRSTSLLPVSINGLVGGADNFLLDDVRLVLTTDVNTLGLDDAQIVAFTPFTLPPGESRFIGVIGRFPPCADARPNWAPGVGLKIVVLRLDVRVAGVLPMEADVPLLQPLELRGNADVACPRA